MTVTYTADVATAGIPSNFLRLLFRWHGSIYKLVLPEMAFFLAVYVLLAVCYRNIMDEETRRIFEGLVIFCKGQSSMIPLSFVLGFYVSIVMGRWWAQYIAIPWPDSIAILVSSNLHGFDDRARAMRRTILRYVCLCQVIVFTLISPSVKRRFPTYNQIVEAGLLQENEKNIIEALDVAFPYYPKHWMPVVWAATIVGRARRENKIRDDYAVKTIIDELNFFRGSCGFLLYYDWVSVPLVYTQVVTLATYTFFGCSIIGQQWIANADDKRYSNRIMEYFPILTILQYFFYMGWLKVAESLINPFGEDDDDFELNWMIDRNLTISYLIVDGMHREHPELLKDQYWDEVFPNELPYTNESQRPALPEASTARLFPTAGANVQSRSNRSFEPGRRRKNDPTETLANSTLSFVTPATSIAYPQVKAEMDSSLASFNGSFAAVGSLSRSRTERPRQSGDIRPSATSLNLEDLIEQRNRERRERLRYRLLNMRPSQRPPMSGGYIVTVLRPPSPRSSQRSDHNEEQADHEREPDPEPDTSNTNQKKNA